MQNMKIKGDTIIEFIATPPAREPPAQVRTVPRVGFEHEIAGGLAYFMFCPCGSEIFSASPILSCPSCHRKP